MRRMLVAASPLKTAIHAESVVRRFSNVTALDGVSLAIQEGEFFSLLGPSGCGKTTLLRLIAGLDHADAGGLTILGRSAAGWPAHERPINTVFQSYALFPHLTVSENIAFGLKMKKVPSAEINTRVSRAMDIVQIAGLGARRTDELSGGQKQRVALARAVVNEPRILLLDEPLGALDLKLRKQLQIELHQLQKRLGITFVYVTHDQDEALTMSDRIAVMNHGNIVQLGSPEELYESPRNRFVAQFLGSCNLIEGKSKDASAADWLVETVVGDLCVGSVKLPAGKGAGNSLTLAIRPEKVLVGRQRSTGRSNEFGGVIADVIYTGAETNYLVRIGSQEFKCLQFNSPGYQHFIIGESVVIHFPPDALILLED
jgi:spermidine/putrescine transport system ATP-binding protein